MKLFVKVKPNAKKELVLRIDEASYKVAVSASPEKGRANKALIDALARYFDIPKSRISISAGHTTRNKIVNIQDKYPLNN